jgi:hypothetical protein
MRLAADGILKPDGHVGRMGIYKASRWEELRQIIRENVIYYGVGSFITNPEHPLNFQ